ncbi:MAG: hypothetical protein WC357_09890, partial [Candidatus Omnitrophota bacterium]
EDSNSGRRVSITGIEKVVKDLKDFQKKGLANMAGVTGITEKQILSKDYSASSPIEGKLFGWEAKFINFKLFLASIAGMAPYIGLYTAFRLDYIVSDTFSLVEVLFFTAEAAFLLSVGYFLWVVRPVLNLIAGLITEKVASWQEADLGTHMFSATLFAGAFAEGMAGKGPVSEFVGLFAVLMLSIGAMYEQARQLKSRISETPLFIPVVIIAILTGSTFVVSSMLWNYLKPLHDSYIAQAIANQYTDFCAVPLFVLATPVLWWGLRGIAKLENENGANTPWAVNLIRSLPEKYYDLATYFYTKTSSLIFTALFWATGLSIVCEVLGFTSTPDVWDVVAYYAGGALFVAGLTLVNVIWPVEVELDEEEQVNSVVEADSSSPVTSYDDYKQHGNPQVSRRDKTYLENDLLAWIRNLDAIADGHLTEDIKQRMIFITEYLADLLLQGMNSEHKSKASFTRIYTELLIKTALLYRLVNSGENQQALLFWFNPSDIETF